MSKISLAAALLLATSGVCQAQQAIEWKQTINMPKGQTLPREQADILGIEFGDSYAEAKAKLEKLAAEGKTPEPVEEEKTEFRTKVPGASTVVTASFVALLIMKRGLPGKANRSIDERIQVYLSAPSSGHQVLGIERNIEYYTEADQPRVSELLAQIKQKLRSGPREYPISDQSEYVFQFNDGQPFQSQERMNTCYPAHATGNAANVPQINSKGTCDAVMTVKVGFGISRDHAKYIYFTLSDNERAKANLTADFAFVRDYVRSYQQKTGGAAPKL